MRINAGQSAWLQGLRDDLGQFVTSLQHDDHSGRYRPCRDGSVEAGTKAALGFGCFAKKILDATGLWPQLTAAEQRTRLDFLHGFQLREEEKPPFPGMTGAFLDKALLRAIPAPPESWRAQMKRRWQGAPPPPDPRAEALLAETKQAIATLAWSDEPPRVPFGGFPRQPAPLLARLNGLDWSRPWGAGAKSAALAVFIRTQGPRLPDVETVALQRVMTQFLQGLVDPTTGGYFRAPSPPPRGQLINGAMKVLNALEWLDEPIHQPERLIDTCLLQGPPPAGCHVVDWIFVVHRCLGQTDHRRLEIQQQAVTILDLIRRHQNRDKGFSYAPGQAQSHYYGAAISRGLDEGDLHGSCLLTWAVAMIVEILELDLPGWKPFRA
ncbi:MAG: hypothetical protein HQM00_00180 [Magnetococcales bacterium]|nr:hypothetical protein [Magnetococcales bacterium]